MKKLLRIRNFNIGEGNKTFVIAEIGINHHGNFEKCKKLIKAASKCGADAAKIQLVSVYESYEKKTTSFNEFKDKNFSDDQLRELKKYAEKNNILFFATPGDISSLKRLLKLKFEVIKISSGLSNNFPLIREGIKSKKILIISTGMSNKTDLMELRSFLNKFKFKKVVILKCVSNYPTLQDDVNLNSILFLKRIFNLNVGYSDHTLGDIAVLSAVSLGACVIEKHFTLNKRLKGADHKISMEPKEFKDLIKKIRTIERIKGKQDKIISKDLLNSRWKNFRYLVSKNDIRKGEKFSLKNIIFKRQKKTAGLLPKVFFKIEGKKAKTKIKKNRLIKITDF